MRLNLITASVLAIASHTLAATTFILNRCLYDVWLTTTDSAQMSAGPSVLQAGTIATDVSTSVGNSLGITKNDQYWSPNTPKMIFGISSSNGTVYWSVNEVDGDPFAGQGFHIASPTCEETDNYDNAVHSCADNGVIIHIDLCG